MAFENDSASKFIATPETDSFMEGREWYRSGKYGSAPPVNFKYPKTVGEDFNTSINYNSHEASNYAKMRMQDKREGFGIKEDAYEPFIFFEFLEVMSEQQYKLWKKHKKDDDTSYFEKTGRTLHQKGPELDEEFGENAQVYYNVLGSADQEISKAFGLTEEENTWFDKAKRVYNGSVALYMPTDIAVNDTIVYNEETRQIAGTIEGIRKLQDASLINSTTGTSTAFLSALGFAGTYGAEQLGEAKWLQNFSEKAANRIQKLGNKGFGVLGGAGLAQVLGPEMQRHTGRLLNPHEYMAYQSTTMRNFTFNWTFLPDNPDESKMATSIIKHFRKSAHATKNDYLRLTVPDHVVVSFHGAGNEGVEMIQLPPTVIETVGVTYNPNNASYFKHNNAPVEIALTVTLKEIVPLYRDDVEMGY